MEWTTTPPALYFNRGCKEALDDLTRLCAGAYDATDDAALYRARVATDNADSVVDQISVNGGRFTSSTQNCPTREEW